MMQKIIMTIPITGINIGSIKEYAIKRGIPIRKRDSIEKMSHNTMSAPAKIAIVI
jgi:hypothetical protein